MTRKRKAHNRLNIDVEFVTREYLSGRTAQSIATELGVSKKSILTRLKEEGVSRRQQPTYPEVTKEVLAELYINQKLSTRTIAGRFGCSSRYIIARLEEYGIPTRLHAGDPSFTEDERKEKWGVAREEHPMWKGGVTGINEALRGATEDWRNSELRRNDYTCYVTGKRGGDMHVHHTTPFHVMRDEMITELGFDMRPTISDYTDLEVEVMRERIAEMHKGERGYVLTPLIHKLFHTQYGFDTDYNDLVEFKTRYQKGEFNESEAIA